MKRDSGGRYTQNPSPVNLGGFLGGFSSIFFILACSFIKRYRGLLVYIFIAFLYSTLSFSANHVYQPLVFSSMFLHLYPSSLFSSENVGLPSSCWTNTLTSFNQRRYALNKKVWNIKFYTIRFQRLEIVDKTHSIKSIFYCLRGK